MTPIIFHEECWDVEIHLIVPAVSAALKEYIRNVTGDDYDPGEFRGLCFYSGGKSIIALESPWSNSINDIAVLSHEAVHATTHILSAREIPHTADTEECFAYLQESILRRCLLALKERATIEAPQPIPPMAALYHADDAPF